MFALSKPSLVAIQLLAALLLPEVIAIPTYSITIDKRTGPEFLGFRGVPDAVAQEYEQGQFHKASHTSSAELGQGMYLTDLASSAADHGETVCLIFYDSSTEWRSEPKVWMNNEKFGKLPLIANPTNPKLLAKYEENRAAYAKSKGVTSSPFVRFGPYGGRYDQMVIPYDLVQQKNLKVLCFKKGDAELDKYKINYRQMVQE
ncbi:hypothetical protein K435DRAFT_877335 [Dendrothele bispora CBS 962.96]|uniref:Uncharacterized protein n=1 Tax=Dendrothele bispora (strain CBS 962.96) TaxID=1314807 RepID=A0A4S8KQB7_DENBC|nr:hypothetical protein K435DRAFT_877335 [Dendrothele bispora CBS 962.96]